MAYITLDTFTACALAVASTELVGADADKAAEKLASQYQGSYDDHQLFEEIIDAKNEIIKWLKMRFPNEHNLPSLAKSCETLALAMRKFDGNGKRRRKFFNGTLFRKNQDRITNKASRSVENVILYDTMIRTGIIHYSSIR